MTIVDFNFDWVNLQNFKKTMMKFEIIKSEFNKNNLKAHIFWCIIILITNTLLSVIFYKTKFFTNGSVAIFALINILLANKLIL
ncbi:MAG: hypothetical protein CLLPBCKN_007061 [Chroococcidiopsis cubana SAG 39.79]|nr:hypothetical protein [Chroococcidiopsis cubana SAG 39.79]